MAFPCTRCDKHFEVRRYLNNHIRKVHEKPRREKVTCEICAKRFTSKQSLKVHRRSLHKVVPAPAEPEPVEEAPEVVQEAPEIDPEASDVVTVPETPVAPELIQQLIQTPKLTHQLIKKPELSQKLIQSPELLQQLVKAPKLVHQLFAEAELVQQLVQAPKLVQQLLRAPDLVLQLVQTPDLVLQLVQSPELVHQVIRAPEVVQQLVQTPEVVPQLAREPELLNLENSLCEICQKVFRRKHLPTHLREIHKLGRLPGKKDPMIHCPECREQIPAKKDVAQHLVDVHQIDIARDNLIFSTFKEFLNWKSETETNTNSYYSRKRHRENQKETVNYFGCNYSGYYQRKSNSQRPSPGSMKINAICPAGIVTRTNNSTGETSVEYVKTHVGHVESFPKRKKRSNLKQDIQLAPSVTPIKLR